MDNYDTLLFYLIYAAIFILSYQVKWKRRNWFIIITFTLLVGLRGVGIDYHGYKGQFEFLSHLHYGLFDSRYYNAYIDEWSTTQFEPFYLLLIKVIKFFNGENYWFFTVIAFLQIFFYENFVSKFKKGEKMMMAFVFFGSLIFIETFNTMRQFVAFFAYLNIVHYIPERNWKKYFGYGILLYCFHSSIVFLLPLYFFIDMDLLKGKKILQIVVYLVVVVGSTYFVNQLSELMNHFYAATGNVEGLKTQYLDADVQTLEANKSAMTHVYRLITFVFMVYCSDEFKEKYGKNGVIFYNMTFIGYLLTELAFNMGIYRMTYYFFYNVFIVMGLMLYMYLQKFKRGHVIEGVVAGLIMALYVAWFSNAVIKGANECAPYELSPELFVDNITIKYEDQCYYSNLQG
jgi:hypothetical protein